MKFSQCLNFSIGLRLLISLGGVIQQYNKIKQVTMYSQINFPANLPNNQPSGLASPKFASNNYPKAFDKTLPTNTLKHYSSNPNLSLEITHPRPQPPQPLPDFKQFNPQISARNPDYRGHPSPNMRSKNDLTKSLIITEDEKRETPQEGSSPKKQTTRLMPRRPRMSEAIEDAPRELFMARREEPMREVNFLKNKEQKSEEQSTKGEERQVVRQTPSFLSRTNSMNMDLKRSLIVDSSFEHRIDRPSQFPFREKKAKKVSVDDFVKLKQLGNGKYGRVYLARQRTTNFICALKVIEKKLLREEEIIDQFTRQVKIQMFLNHPNIIKMYGCFSDQLNIYIILEVGSGGQLYHQLKKAQPLAEPRIAFIMKQVCEAVNEIHSLRIIHRDIKPENIVLHDNIVKLCDFGWSVHQDNKLRTTFCGTPLYVCPEILKGREYDEKIDIWSIGIMMYEMVVGENPFKITREEELIKIVKDEIKIPSYLFVSNEVRDFLDKCLQKNPNERAAIKELINHPFFKKHQDKSDKSKLIQV